MTDLPESSARTSRARRALAAAALLAIAIACRPADSDPPPALSAPSVLVQTAVLERGSVVETISAIGQVDWDATRMRTIVALAAGEVLEVRVVPGAAVRRGVVLARIGPVPAGTLDARRAQIEVEYARRGLERTQHLRQDALATNGDVASAQKALALAVADLKNLGGEAQRAHDLLAPEDGLIAQVELTPGILVQAGQAAFALAPPDALRVRVGFELQDAERFHEGDAVTLTPLFDLPGAAPIAARVGERPALVDPNTQLAEAFVRVPETARGIFAGQRVRVDVVRATVEQALVVPRAALTLRGGQEGVFVVQGDRARWRLLVVGARSESRIQALSGVEAGEAVVVAGHSSLEDNTPIRRGAAEGG